MRSSPDIMATLAHCFKDGSMVKDVHKLLCAADAWFDLEHMLAGSKWAVGYDDSVVGLYAERSDGVRTRSYAGHDSAYISAGIMADIDRLGWRSTEDDG